MLAENRHVLDCNAAAYAQGVRPRMTRAAAAALAPHLCVHERDADAEHAALEGAAAWAGRYTPNVALVAGTADNPQGLLLEVSGSLKLFGGITAIVTDLARSAAELGFSAAVASAPTAQGAWLLARGGCSSPCTTPGDLARRLHPLPIETLDCGTHTRTLLEAVGIRTVGEVLALPRAGVARRFGPRLLEELDRACGTRPDPRVFFIPPERFEAGLELPAEVHEAGALVFALGRLIAQLDGFLAARDRGVQRLRITLFHRETHTDVEIGLVRPSGDAAHFALLVREKLAALRLREPVRRIALFADELLTLAHENLDLLDDALKPGDNGSARIGTLVERLRARLGSTAVAAVAANADHRPEAAWRVAEPGDRSAACALGARPLWLLQTPKRLEERSAAPQYGGPLALLAGPERIESGWWDGRDAVRDYFIARAATEALLWIYRERGLEGNKNWYLHGIFG